MNPEAPDFGIQRNYGVVLDLPWNEYSKDNFDLKSKKILDRDHFELEELKNDRTSCSFKIAK
jgi:ATP-dependent Lon protease